VQAGEAELQRRRPERITPADRILLDQPEAAEAHQVGVGARGRQPGGGGQILQRHGRGLPRQRDQQPPADLHRLHRALLAHHSLFHANEFDIAQRVP
jgi:hypothetical protein